MYDVQTLQRSFHLFLSKFVLVGTSGSSPNRDDGNVAVFLNVGLQHAYDTVDGPGMFQ